MRRPLAWLLGAVAVFGFVRRRREAQVEQPDPRAEELRRKLAESREVVEEAPEAQPEEEDPDARRRALHESARETVQQMRKR